MLSSLKIYMVLNTLIQSKCLNLQAPRQCLLKQFSLLLNPYSFCPNVTDHILNYSTAQGQCESVLEVIGSPAGSF